MKKIQQPQFFIIGAQKAGTSTIHDLFRFSEKVYAPREYKDYHIFNNPVKNRLHIENYKTAEYPFTLHCGVNYIISKRSIKYINEEFPNAKYIIILRNPIKRAVSAFKYMKRMGIENGSMEEFFKTELQNPLSIIDPDKSYLEHGLYGSQIKENVFSQVPAERVGIFLFEEIFKNNSINIDSIIDFMGIPSFNYPTTHAVNIGGDPKYSWLNRFLYKSNNLKSALAKITPVSLRSRIKQTIYEKNRTTKKTSNNPSLNTATKEKLKDYYRKDVQILSSIMKKDLTKFWHI